MSLTKYLKAFPFPIIFVHFNRAPRPLKHYTILTTRTLPPYAKKPPHIGTQSLNDKPGTLNPDP